jgi:membrane associated rhomboid family serine protease
MPLSDRDYMRRPAPSRGYHYGRGYRGFTLNPVWVLIGINLLFYVVALISGKYNVYQGNVFIGQMYKLNYILGLQSADFLAKPWTVVTAMFLHAGFWHIFGNMITLYFFGMALYRLIGQNRFLLLYFVGGIVGNVLFLLYNLYVPAGEPLSIVVGASGAIFAVAGALAVMAPRIQVRVYFVLPMPLWAVVLIFFGLWSIPNFISGVAWQAHLGGLVTGLIFGYFFRRSRRFYVY